MRSSRLLLVGLGIAGIAALASPAGAAPRAGGALPGTLADVDRYVRAALRAPGGEAILVISLSADDFVQLTAESGDADFSFPLLTSDQRAGESELRKLLKELRLTAHEQSGTNGTRFLDVPAGSNADSVIDVTRTLLMRLHGATDKTPLDFDCQGCADLPTPRHGR